MRLLCIYPPNADSSHRQRRTDPSVRLMPLAVSYCAGSAIVSGDYASFRYIPAPLDHRSRTTIADSSLDVGDSLFLSPDTP